MASRKKQPDTQASLFAAPQGVSAPMPSQEERLRELEAAHTIEVIPERPKLRLVPKVEALESEVLVEKVKDGATRDEDIFEVSNLRRYGATVCAVFYTRAQLEQLIKRSQSALEL